MVQGPSKNEKRGEDDEKKSKKEESKTGSRVVVG